MLPVNFVTYLPGRSQLDLRAVHGNSGGPVFSQESGKVFGIMQGGLTDQRNQLIFARAESVYPVIDTNRRCPDSC